MSEASDAGDWHRNLVEDDTRLAAILTGTRSIAVVGMKDDPAAAAYRIPAYMHAHGYRVLPVSPKLAATALLGEAARATLADLDQPVDMVDVFRAADNVPAHADEALRMPVLPRVFWMQLGIRHDGAAARLARAGILVVQDRCLLIEHRRLVRPG